MPKVRVVLVRPENAANVGAVARVVANTGLEGVDVVAPCDWRTLEAWRMAWRSEDILEATREFTSLDEALEGAVYVAGLSGRSGMRIKPITPRAMAAEIAALDASAQVALVFGCESQGLTENDLRHCQRRVGIPADPRQPSLNLAQSVMVTCYEVYQVQAPEQAPLPRAPFEDVEPALAKLEEALLDVNFFTADNVGPRFAEWRELFGRAGLTPREVKLVLALARKVRNLGRMAQQSTFKKP
jgi:TrmH family RNA methyltransferase